MIFSRGRCCQVRTISSHRIAREFSVIVYCTADRHVSREIQRKRVGKRRERGVEGFMLVDEEGTESRDMMRRYLTVGVAYFSARIRVIMSSTTRAHARTV